MYENIKDYVRNNVLTLNEVAATLQITKSQVLGFVKSEDLIPLKQICNESLFLRNDVLNFKEKLPQLFRKSKDILFDEAGASDHSVKFFKEHIDKLSKIQSIYIYNNRLDAVNDGFYLVDEDSPKGKFYYVKNPSFVIRDINGKELWFGALNCGYGGTGPNSSIRVLKQLREIRGINLTDEMIKSIYYNYVVKIFIDESDNLDLIAHGSLFEKKYKSLNKPSADHFYYKDNLVLLQSVEKLDDKDPINVIDKYQSFIPEPVEIVIFPNEELALESGYYQTTYSLVRETIYPVIITDKSGRQLWIKPKINPDIPLNKQESIIEIIKKCGFYLPQENIYDKVVGMYNKVMKDVEPTPLQLTK